MSRSFLVRLTDCEADCLLRALDLVRTIRMAANRRERPDMPNLEDEAEERIREGLAGIEPARGGRMP